MLAIACSTSASAASLYPKYCLRATPMRAPLSASFVSAAAYSARFAGSLIAVNSNAASLTVRAIGPAVSWLCEIGMMPALPTSPTVGLMPTRPLTADGHTIDPSVSVPTPIAARFAAMAAPVPELDPHGLRSSA